MAELVAAGLATREARWIAEEFAGDARAPGAIAAHDAARRRLAGEPLQYVLGHWPFRSLDLEVDPRVLIPRPETEGLVDVALGELARHDRAGATVVDLGCGSGAIGLSIVTELAGRGEGTRLVALDASPGALEVARRNARRHQVTNATFVQSTWFDALDRALVGRIDLIVANPPYVGALEYADLEAELAHEPYQALVAPDAEGVAGFGDLATIIAQAGAWLRPGGSLVCEHGADQRDAAMAAARRAGYDQVEDHDDLSGRPRVLVARR